MPEIPGFSTILYILLIFSADTIYGDRTSQKVYRDIEASGFAACFRRLNGTHQIGCSSGRKGSVGVLHFIEESEDVSWLIERGPHEPYVVLLTPEQFNRDVIDRLRKSGKVNGLLVDHSANETSPQFFSPDKECPNDGYGLYSGRPGYDSDCSSKVPQQGLPWGFNGPGKGLGFEDLPFPVMALTNSTDVHYLKHKCYGQFNKPSSDGTPRTYPLCSAQVKDAMDAAKDTPTCIRRSNLQMNLNPDNYCDPLENRNVHIMTKEIPANISLQEESVIMIGARIDSFSMFDKMYPGANSPVTGLVTLLATAQALQSVKDSLKGAKKLVLFSMFHGESFDYIGSSRVVFDMAQDNFPNREYNLSPVKLENIDHFIEVSQIGKDDLWIHTDPVSNTNTTMKHKVEALKNKLQEQGRAVNITLSESALASPLPPASLQSFLKKRNISGLVIADHNRQYFNKFYNSRFDVSEVIKASYPPDLNKTERYDYVTPAAERISKLSTVIARVVYELATGNDTNDISADSVKVANMLYCFLHSPRCELFRTVLSDDNANRLASQPYPFYISVKGDQPARWIPLLLQPILAYFLGEEVNITNADCERLDRQGPYGYTWMQGPIVEGDEQPRRLGLCIKSTSFHTLARSPAFDEGINYDWKSKEFSSWSESVWAADAMFIRAFLVPSKGREVMTLLVGLLIFLGSLPLIFCIEKRSHLLFNSHHFQAVH